MLTWWMRIVGAFYLVKFVAVAIVKAPIQAQAPGALDRAAAGDPVARLLVDAWVIFGLEMAALGLALIVASRRAAHAPVLVLAILAVELSGIAADLYQLARGHAWTVPLPWIAVHALILVTGIRALRRTQ